MKPIADLLKVPEKGKSKIVNERQAIIKDFMDLLLPEWNRTKPLTVQRVAYITSHLSKEDLYYMLSEGKKYQKKTGSFSKYFFGTLKKRPGEAIAVSSAKQIQ